jgi:hypothetical protein
MERFDVHVGLKVCERFAADTRLRKKLWRGKQPPLQSARSSSKAQPSARLRFSPEIFTEGNEGNKKASPTLQILRCLRLLANAFGVAFCKSLSRQVGEREARSPGRRGDRSPEFR